MALCHWCGQLRTKLLELADDVLGAQRWCDGYGEVFQWLAAGSVAMWLVTGWLPRADASGAARFTGSQPVVSG
jgi:hypothetical protein